MRADPWTAERVEMLRRLWAGGETAQSIADRLGGVSRSAVMGKIFRLRAAGAASAAGMRARTGSSDSTAKAASAASRASSSPLPFARPAAPARRRRGGEQGDPRPGAGATVPTRGKSLLDLGNNSCRWPHGRPGTPTFFFCGASGADLERGKPYCPGHARRAYCNDDTATPAVVAGRKPRAAPSPASLRRCVWRAKVRHPATRWR